MNVCEICPSCGKPSWSAAKSSDGLCDACAGRLIPCVDPDAEINLHSSDDMPESCG